MSKIFISFVGTNGSGKSTLVDCVFVRVRENDKKIKKRYGRYTPYVLKYIMALGRRLFRESSTNVLSDYDIYLKSKQTLFKRASLFSKFYIHLIILEYYLELIFKIVIPYRLGYSIVADRYVYDTIINDIAIDMQLSTNDVNKLLRKFWLLIPRPDITFLVQIPEHVAIRRKNDIPSLSYLKIRNKFYNEMALPEQFVILDGTLEISKLEQRVLDEIRKYRK